MNTIIVEQWNEYLEQFEHNQKDIYYCEEYVKLYEETDSKALCIISYEENNVLLMPYLRKEIDGYYDFETAYGYGGPISNTDDWEWNKRALDAMELLFQKEKYICGFIRFHTLIDNVELCHSHMKTLFDRDTVAIDTQASEEDIWAHQIVSKNRNMIRKAEKNGLEYRAEYDFASLKEFVELYHATMKRLGAEDFYFFDEDYYQKFAKAFAGKAFLGTVRKDGKLICAALFMYSQEYGHYHLEGSDHSQSSLGANNYLLWKTALEFHKLGVKEFHLGGGYNAESDNSLLKFKKSFNNRTKKFYIGKWIFDQEKYNRIKEEWERQYPEKIEAYGKLLLCYRY